MTPPEGGVVGGWGLLRSFEFIRNSCKPIYLTRRLFGFAETELNSIELSDSQP